MHDAMGDTGSSPEVIEGRAPVLIAEKYRVLRVLGEGGTGIVYLCEHLALEKQVAVKVLHRELANNKDLVARFQREAQTAARFDHPSLVHVMDFGQDKDGTLYLAMEYVQGRDLADLLNDEWPLSDERIAHIMGCVLSALSAAHALGIVHRDLKPENILVRASEDPSAPELVKICDFGIAQLSPVRLARADRPSASLSVRVTGEGTVVGTPWYMSPEQARAETLDARSDVYAAGVVLFQLLTRTLPFMADSAVAVAVMHCTTPPPPPSGYGPVHPGLESVCLRALSKTREARFQSANEMLAALKAAVAKPAPNRRLTRRSRTSAVPPVRALPSGSGDVERLSSAVTELSTPAVRVSLLPDAGRKRKTSLLVAAVAVTLLAIASVPRLRSAQHSRAPEPAPESSAALSSAAAESAAMSLPPSEVLESTPAEWVGSSVAFEPDRAAEDAQVAPPLAAQPSGPSARPVRSPAPREPARNRKQEPLAQQPSESEPRVELAAAVQPEPAEKLRAALTAHALPLEAAKVVEPKPEPSAVVTEAPAAPVPVAAPELPAVAPTPTPAPAVHVAAPAETKAVSPAPAAVSGKVDGARVSIVTERATAGVSKSSLRAALNLPALTRCYQDALRAGADLGRSTTASLEIATNLGGRITSAQVSTGLPAALRECLEQSARSGQIRGAEAGEVRATFGLKLER